MEQYLDLIRRQDSMSITTGENEKLLALNVLYSSYPPLYLLIMTFYLNYDFFP